jgi:hypothetical protein
MRLRFWLLPALAALLILLGELVSTAAPIVYASAATPSISHVSNTPCSGPHCNGSDPYGSGCAGDGTSYWVVDSVPVVWKGITYGWTQLWYSGTCGTNWARYVCSASCRPVTLTLMVCNANGSHTGVQGPIDLDATGRTKQQYLPTTKASAYLMFNISGTVFSGAETGCY